MTQYSTMGSITVLKKLFAVTEEITNYEVLLLVQPTRCFPFITGASAPAADVDHLIPGTFNPSQENVLVSRRTWVEEVWEPHLLIITRS